MVKKHFKRSNELICQMVAILLVLIALIFNYYHIFSVLTYILFFISFIMLIINIFFQFNDFDYTIEDFEDYIIFSTDDSHVRIDKHFLMHIAPKHKLVLEDDYSSISVYSNYEVVKFLKEINN